jgi:hypothetical protein
VEAIAMPQLSLEQRVAALERHVADIKAQNVNGPRKKDWRRTVGMFAGDEALMEIFEEAMKLREKDRQRAYRRFDKKASKGKANR